MPEPSINNVVRLSKRYRPFAHNLFDDSGVRVVADFQMEDKCADVRGRFSCAGFDDVRARNKTLQPVWMGLALNVHDGSRRASFLQAILDSFRWRVSDNGFVDCHHMDL